MSDLLDPVTETPQARARRIGEAGRAAIETFHQRPSGDAVLAELRSRLDGYRRAKTDMSVAAVPASELYLLANRVRVLDFKSLSKRVAGEIEAVLAEYDAVLIKAMPHRSPPVRRRLA